MWGIIIGSMLVVAILGGIFLWTRFGKFGIVQMIAGDSKWKRRLLALIPFLIFGIFAIFSVVNVVIVMVHMAVYWALAELIYRIVHRIRHGKKVKTETGETADDSKSETKAKSAQTKKQEDQKTSDKKTSDKKISGKKSFRPYWVGIIVLCFELCYFTTGWYLAHHVWEKDYTVTTTKDLGMEKLRIAQIADSHVGVTFDGEDFAKHLETIEATNPDVLFITGDFVDDDTSKEDMYRCCLALAGFKCKYGVYYVYGNHDKGYFRYRNFTADELREALEAAGVRILQDEVEMIADKIYVVGRRDKSVKDRIEIGTILSLLDPKKFTIVLDHQPNDYAAEAAAGADLVLSGHTHGGQMLEINFVGQMIGANDKTYGMEKRDNTTFIVTSGISDWAIKFKTGTNSEFVIVDVVHE